MRFLIPLLLFVSCTQFDDAYCYVVDYVEVGGERIKVGEQRCGCFPTSPLEQKTVEYQGRIYNAKTVMECH